MKTLKQHVILYDEACPMCNLYTKAFVEYRFLDKEGRATYQQMPDSLVPLVDCQRAVNEIALVDTCTGNVTYGVQSLMKILAYRFPFLRALFQFKPFSWIVAKVYGFISYNRRVIMPPTKEQPKQFEPSLHKGYRIAYLLFTWIITAFILNSYSKTLIPLLPAFDLFRELLICGGQLLWQGVVVCMLNKEKAWDYVGNLMTISFAGALLLEVGLFVQSVFSLENNYGALGYFFLVVGFMFLEHVRRTRLLQLSWLLTLSWVLYRCLVLIFII